MTHDIIYAPITAKGGAIFVVRISGNYCLEEFFKNIQTNKKISQIKEKYAHVIKIFFDEQNTLQELDEVILVYFADSKSFTGEDTIEISLHGGSFIINKFLEILNKIPNFRFAKNGEFTKRAFLNGKIDLLKAESINGLIKAENRKQHILSSKFFSGNASSIYAELRNKVLHLLSKFELLIDFPEEDIPSEVFDDIKELQSKLQQHLQKCQKINDINSLNKVIKIGFFGNPNAGKSSLLNAISKREVAIVSNTKGTTRDILTTEINIKDEKIIICDTAGIRTAKNKIEQEGVKRSLSIMQDVDIKIFLFDSNNFLNNIDQNKQMIQLAKDSLTKEAEVVILMTKFDLIKKNQYNIQKEIISFLAEKNIHNVIFFSIFSEENLIILEEKIYNICQAIKPSLADSLILNERHFLITKKIEEEISKINPLSAIELLAEDFRNILFLIEEITGEIKTDDILDKIFREFCIGK